MFPIVAAVFASLGGGYLIKKVFFDKKADKPSAAASPGSAPIASQRVDEFLELRSDGLYQFNRQTAVAVLGWLASVQAKSAPSVEEGVALYDLVASSDGSPPPVGTAAGKILVTEALAGKTALVSRDITMVGAPFRRAAVSKGNLDKLAGKGGKYAILIVPAAESIEPRLPPMPGFEGVEKSIPGATPLPEKKAVAKTGADEVSELPPEIRAMIDDVLKKQDASADDLEAIARQLRLGGYPRNAEMIEKKAADMRATEVVQAVELRTAFVIPKGHKGAVALAKRLTGDGRRVRELLDHNKNLEVKDGVVRPWVPGQIVKLPPSWSK